MPGKGSKRRRGKKGSKCPSTTRAETLRHPGLTPFLPQQGRRPLVDFGGGLGMVQGWTLRSPTDPRRTTGSSTLRSNTIPVEVYSTGSYNPYMDCCEGYADYGGNGECSDVSLRSDLGFDCVEDPSMEVEEVFFGDPPTDSDLESAVSRSDEPPPPKIPPKAPPRRCRSGASKPFRPLGHTAREAVHLYLSLVEARRKRHQCPSQRLAK
ncbi:hypothetical protein P4O66_001552 [Electrophorus voltai]|uniref:Uncharacterized protein n=1 Tax=Electrophorus voltai TaxID=2609070 RepID=A0AAD8Z9D1_9TELE|nr:hypothetical protein P4O66_001552 [Electrophorus voltai]